MSEGPSRGEFEQLARRVELIETRGSSGVQALQVQVNDLIKDVTKLESSVETKFHAHEIEHRQDAAARVSGRRWLVGTMIAAAMLLLAILGLVISIAGQHRVLRETTLNLRRLGDDHRGAQVIRQGRQVVAGKLISDLG